MAAKRRIALYGGTFDPVHVGHLEVAGEIARLFEIEKVIFVPAELAPHKTGRAVTSSIHRYAMLALATQASPKLVISTFELDAPDRRYTVDTVSHFQKALGPDVELFFIMGADSWSEISSWREWERLLAMVNHIVVARPGYPFGEPPIPVQRIVDLRTDAPRDELIRSNEGSRVFITNAVMRDVSASSIRLKAGAGKFNELEDVVPGPVFEYIKKYRLYQDSNDARPNS
jgi:nicotinate-nucleotide adenylyltransferase